MAPQNSYADIPLVPYVSILTSCCWGLLALVNLKVTAGQVFAYMTSVAGSAAYIAWAGIIFTHLRVRSGLVKQGIHIDIFL
jgi:yeast amino acid transporter